MAGPSLPRLPGTGETASAEGWIRRFSRIYHADTRRPGRGGNADITADRHNPSSIGRIVAIPNTGDLMNKRLWAWCVLLIMGASWGLSFSLARIAAVDGVHPLSITFWEAAGAGIIVIALGALRGRFIVVSRELLLLYLAAGVLGMVLPCVIFFYAAAHVPAGVLSISLAITPVLTFIISASIGLESLVPTRILGVLMGTLSIVLLVVPQQSLPDPAQLPWLLFSLTAAVPYGALNVMMAKWKPLGVSPFGATAGMFLAASLIMIPVLYATDTFVAFDWPWADVEWALFGLGVINAIGYSLKFHLIDAAGPVFTSLTTNLVTLFGVFWGIVIFGEQHSSWVWLSLAAMMGALALVKPRARSGPTNTALPAASQAK
jgi:drug/metabolite transporter (DMT)-like permease